MATARDLCFTPAVELLKLYRTRKVSPLEVMQAVLARIDAVTPAVNAIVTLAPDAALREARRATASLRRGSACRRRDRDRQDQHAGVRLRPEHGEHGLRGDAQSLEPRADGGRIERPRRRRARHPPVPPPPKGPPPRGPSPGRLPPSPRRVALHP